MNLSDIIEHCVECSGTIEGASSVRCFQAFRCFFIVGVYAKSLWSYFVFCRNYFRYVIYIIYIGDPKR